MVQEDIKNGIVKQIVEQAAKGSKKALKKLILLREHVEENGELEPFVFNMSAADAQAI